MRERRNHVCDPTLTCCSVYRLPACKRLTSVLDNFRLFLEESLIFFIEFVQILICDLSSHGVQATEHRSSAFHGTVEKDDAHSDGRSDPCPVTRKGK